MIRSFYPLLLISRDENFKQLMKVSDSPISSSLFAVYNAPVSCALGFVWAGTAGECAQHLDGLWPAALAAGLCGHFLFHRIEVPFCLSVVPTLILVPISM